MTTRRVLVTGGGSGIGLAGALALHERGALVAIADLNFDHVPDGVDLPNITVNVTDESAVDQMFNEATAILGGVDVVIHSAGIMREQRRDIREISLESWTNLITTNLTGAFLVARGAARAMIPQGGGVLILVGSGAGTYGPSGSVPYGASKGGINGLVITLEDHLKNTGIRVHNFCPGGVDTPLVQESMNEAIANGFSADTITKARGNLTDVASVGRILAFLASEDADSVTGNIRTL